MNLLQHLIQTAKEFGALAERIYLQWRMMPIDTAILGTLLHPLDASGDTIQQKDTYAWYAAIAMVLKPKRIGEIGVRYGYTLKALDVVEGAELIGFDNQSYISDSNTWVREHLPSAKIITCDTQKLSALPETGFDLIHVDGDHSEQGAYHDLCLAFDAVTSGGWILVDDIHGLYYQTLQDEKVRAGAIRFIQEKKLKYFFLPTFRGMYLIQVLK